MSITSTNVTEKIQNLSLHKTSAQGLSKNTYII